MRAPTLRAPLLCALLAGLATVGGAHAQPVAPPVQPRERGTAAQPANQPAVPPGNQPAAPARATPDADPLELRPIREIRIVRPVLKDGRATGETTPVEPGVSQLVRNQLRTLEGRPLRRALIEEDISRLNRLGRFKRIRSDVQTLADGSAIVIFTVEEQAVIQDVQVIGNRELTDQELLAAITLQPGTPVDRFQIDRAARAIEEKYRQKGYYNVKVAVDEPELEESAIVVLRVVEGQRVRVTGVQFEGNNSFTRGELLSAVKTAVYVPIFEKGPLDDQVLQDDAASLAKFYRDRGYLDVRTSFRVQPAPNGKEALVTFRVEEGPLYTLRGVRVFYETPAMLEKYRTEVLKDPAARVPYLTVEQMRAIGGKPFSEEQITGLMAVKPGDVYGEDKIRRSLRNIEEAYGKLGYIIQRGPFETTTVILQTKEVRDETRPEVDLLLFITEGKPFTLGQINIGRNEITKQQVILRQMDIKVDRPLDYTSLIESQKRLEQLRLFAPGTVRVKVLPPSTAEPTKRDVYVETPETNTGEFNIGAAVDSDFGLIGAIGIVQRNFDIASPPESFGDLFSGRAFRGAGQRFEITAQPGDRSQTYKISLTEPYFLESDYSLGGALLYTKRDYREYDEQRYGGNVTLARRFGPVWTGSLVLRNEWVQLSSIESDAPKDYFDAENEERITGLGIGLTRNTTNDRFRPSKGSRITLGAERVGLPGDTFEFWKLNYELATFFNVNESFLGYKTILKLENRISYIPEGVGEAPVYERWFLGGRTFRGFGNRAVSPIGFRRDGSLSDEPVGGSFLFFLGAEIQQPIYEDILSVVGFVDSGTVDTDISFDKYRVSIGTGIRLYVPALSPVPLAFDFGFPVIKEGTDRKRLFTFSIDIPF